MIYQIKKKELFFLLKYLLLFVAQILIIKTILFSKSSFAQIAASKSCLEIDIKTTKGVETTLRVPGTNCYADCNAMPSGITANPGINGNCYITVQIYQLEDSIDPVIHALLSIIIT